MFDILDSCDKAIPMRVQGEKRTLGQRSQFYSGFGYWALVFGIFFLGFKGSKEPGLI
jgi:hypothetical protein